VISKIRLPSAGSVALRDNRLRAGILPETEHVRSQRRMPIGIRTKRRPFGQQGPQGTAATNSTRDVHRGRVSQQ